MFSSHFLLIHSLFYPYLLVYNIIIISRLSKIRIVWIGVKLNQNTPHYNSGGCLK